MFAGIGCERKILGVGGRFCALSALIAEYKRGLAPLLSSPYHCCIMMRSMATLCRKMIKTDERIATG